MLGVPIVDASDIFSVGNCDVNGTAVAVAAVVCTACSGVILTVESGASVVVEVEVAESVVCRIAPDEGRMVATYGGMSSVTVVLAAGKVGMTRVGSRVVGGFTVTFAQVSQRVRLEPNVLNSESATSLGRGNDGSATSGIDVEVKRTSEKVKSGHSVKP